MPVVGGFLWANPDQGSPNDVSPGRRPQRAIRRKCGRACPVQTSCMHGRRRGSCCTCSGLLVARSVSAGTPAFTEKLEGKRTLTIAADRAIKVWYGPICCMGTTPKGGSHGNPHPTAGFHGRAWRRSGLAARHTRAAAGPGAADRRADGLCRERLGRTGLVRCVPGGTPEARVDGGPQHPDRHPLGVGRRGFGATIREGTCRATARPHCYAKHTH